MSGSASAFAQRREARVSKLLPQLIFRFIPAVAEADQRGNLQLALDFVRSNLLHHSFLSPDASHIAQRLRGIQTTLAVHAHPAHAAALAYLAARLRLLQSRREAASADVQQESAEALLLLLLSLANRPAAAADDDVAIDPHGLRRRMEQLLLANPEALATSFILPAVQQGARIAGKDEPEPDAQTVPGAATVSDADSELSDWSQDEAEHDADARPAKSSVNRAEETPLRAGRLTLVQQVVQQLTPQPKPRQTAAEAAAAAEALLNSLVCDDYPRRDLDPALADAASDWRWHLASQVCAGTTLAPPTTIVTESSLLKECSFALQGSPSSAIFEILSGDAGWRLRSDVHVKDYTFGAAQHALSTTLELAQRLHSLRHASAKLEKSAPQALRAYADALRSCVATLQGQATASLLRLSRLRRWHRHLLSGANGLVDVTVVALRYRPLETAVTPLLDVLMESLAREMLLARTGTQSLRLQLLRTIFLQTMHPVCDFLEELSTRGRVPQPEEGLIFAEIDDKHVAGNPIGVRSDISCPAFLRLSASVYADAAYAVRLLQQLEPARPAADYVLHAALVDTVAPLPEEAHPADQDPHTTVAPKRNDALGWLELALEEASGSSNNEVQIQQHNTSVFSAAAVPDTPLQQLLMEVFLNHAQAMWQECEQRLARLVRSQHGLLSRFHELQDIYCMRNGAVMGAFCNSLFEAMNASMTWHRASYITMLLDEALERYHSPLVGRITASYKASPLDAKNSRGSAIIEQLQLHLTINFPCNLIFDQEAIDVYNRVFCFLLEIKRARWLLAQLHTRGGPNAEIAGVPWHPVFLLRARLITSLQVVEDYFMQRVLYELGTDLERSLLEAATLKELRRAHKSYLDAVTKRCFLIEKTAPVLAAFQRILAVAVRFSELWQYNLSGAAAIPVAASLAEDDKVGQLKRLVTAKDFARLEMEHRECTLFLITMMQSVAGRASLLHLDALGQQLSTGIPRRANGSYALIFPQAQFRA